MSKLVPCVLLFLGCARKDTPRESTVDPSTGETTVLDGDVDADTDVDADGDADSDTDADADGDSDTYTEETDSETEDTDTAVEVSGHYTAIDMDIWGYTCGLTVDGWVDCNGLSGPAPKTEFLSVSMSPSGLMDCGARVSGGIECWRPWDASEPGLTYGDKETFTQISAGAADPWGTYGVGDDYVCGLKTNGEIACWWKESICSYDPPMGTFAQISVDHCHGCALDSAGDVICWGSYASYEFEPIEPAPAGPFVHLDVGFTHDCGVLASGEVACWGHPVYGNLYGQSSPPAGSFVKVVAAEGNTCGITTDGAIECWGRSFEEGKVPDGTFVDVAISAYGGCALNTAQEVVCWGDVYPPWSDG